MKKVETLFELREERKRLLQKKRLLEARIENDFAIIKESLSPVKLVAEGISKTFVNRHPDLVSNIVALISDIILKKWALKKSGFLTRLLVPIIARNTVSNLIHNNKTKILGWLGEQILKLDNRKNHKGIYDKTTADINF